MTPGCTVQAQGMRDVKASAKAPPLDDFRILKAAKSIPASPTFVISTYLGYRITSYNVCYTKLLRLTK